MDTYGNSVDDAKLSTWVMVDNAAIHNQFEQTPLEVRHGQWSCQNPAEPHDLWRANLGRYPAR